MKRAALLLAVLAVPAQAGEPQQLSHGRFENVRLYRPAGTPKSFALLLSGEARWDASMARMAETLTGEGALVAGIDTPQLMTALEADGGECVFADGDLENLAHFVQAYARLDGYRAPVLVGHSSGATLAYATLAQAPAGTFAAGLVTGFCPDLDLKKPLCTGDGLRFRPLPATGQPARGVRFLARPSLATPFAALLGSRDTVCAAAATPTMISQMPAARQKILPGVGHDYGADPAARAALAAAYRSLSATQTAALPPAPAGLGDLPVVEQPVAGNSPYLAVFWSGDGGWAGIDKAVSDALNGHGIPVVGVDSLRYFWTARTPAGIAADIEKISRHYLAAWQKQKVILIGYSQGADVLPFAVNQLGASFKSRLALVAAMGLSDHAVFEFELGNWIADNNSGPEILPEVVKIRDLRFLCIYGEDDDDSICPKLPVAGGLSAVKMPGGHHFDGGYEPLAAAILGALPAPQPAR